MVFNSCQMLWEYILRLQAHGILVQAVTVPLRHVFAAYGLILCLQGAVSWKTVLFAAFLWLVSGLGVTAGAHRLWSHQSYQATATMQALLMIMYSIADQGPIQGWTLTHAMHHSASDTPWDPHNRMDGFWHAHFGWLYAIKQFRLSTADYQRVVSGLGPIVRFHDRHSAFWGPAWSLGMPALVASWWGEALGGLFVAGALRWACVQHITFFVNSVAHGEQEPDSFHAFDAAARGIGPRVSLLTTALAHGEGWHDYHHMFPWDYAAAELDAWDQWNPTKVFIDACCALGIVTGRRRCSELLQQARRRQLLHKAGVVRCSGFRIMGTRFLRYRVPVLVKEGAHAQEAVN